ncbi:MAG: hypothetical protein ABL959_12665 [Pyrinomonadaceae bacterium]
MTTYLGRRAGRDGNIGISGGMRRYRRIGLPSSRRFVVGSSSATVRVKLSILIFEIGSSDLAKVFFVFPGF